MNPEGVKWWLDHDTTAYARAARHGISLPDIQVWLTQRPDGVFSRVIVDTALNRAVYDSQSLESIGVQLDLMKLTRSYDKADAEKETP